MKYNLQRAAENGRTILNNQLYRFGELVMNDSKQNYVPIEEGELQSTGRVEEIESGPGLGAEIQLIYGDGGPSSAYAIAIHEHLSAASPPSWQNTTVRFTRGGPKYLELPLMKHMEDMPAVVGEAFMMAFR